jgi:hypothetical protein
VSPIYSLERKRNKTKRKKGIEWVRKNLHLEQGVAHPLQRHPQTIPTFPCHHCTPCPNIPLPSHALT